MQLPGALIAIQLTYVLYIFCKINDADLCQQQRKIHMYRRNNSDEEAWWMVSLSQKCCLEVAPLILAGSRVQEIAFPSLML